jgi:branched-chain amino acid aminotransferase
MSERVAYVNGQIVPESQATVSIFDRGYMNGVGVFERTRTQSGVMFRLDQHLARLKSSLTMTRLDLGMSIGQLKELTEDVLAKNLPLLGPQDDYSVGHYISLGPGGKTTVIIFCEPLPFASFAQQYIDGGHAVTTWIKQLPIETIDPKMKTTSRLHFHLATVEAQLADPDAYPLLLDFAGNACELLNANFFIVRKGTIISPPGELILRGITREAMFEVADKLGIPWKETTFQVYDVMNADEAFLTTTSKLVLPMTRINGRPIGTGKPGPIVDGLQKGWREVFGFDFIKQALSHLPAAAGRS